MPKNIERKILLNPGPATTTDTVKMAMVVPDICPREADFGRIVQAVRSAIVDVVADDGSHTAVIFPGSGTTAIEATISSVVPEGAGLAVLVNGAYGERICEIAGIHGIATIPVRSDASLPPDLDALRETLDRHSARVTHLAVVHHETTTGLLNPLEDLCRIARDRDIEIIVDAMSSYAAIPIDAQTLQIDYLIASSNKCIQGMAGLGFAVCDRDSLLKAEAVKARTLSLNLYKQHRSLEETGQMQFTPPVQVFYALRQALAEYEEEGGDNRFRRYVENWEELYEGLSGMGFTFPIALEHQSRILLSIVEPDNESYSFEDMHDYLYARGFTIYPGKLAGQQTFRLAILGALTLEDIRAFLGTLRDYLDDRGVRVGT